MIPKKKMDKDIGALWLRSGAKGEYMTGVITVDNVAHQLVAFKNKKTKPNQPDWRIYKSQPKPEMNPNGTEKVETVAESSDVPF